MVLIVVWLREALWAVLIPFIQSNSNCIIVMYFVLCCHFIYFICREHILHLIEEVFKGIMVSLSQHKAPYLVYNSRRNWRDVRLVNAKLCVSLTLS